MTKAGPGITHPALDDVNLQAYRRFPKGVTL
jgi:hypothetical protein